MGPHWQQRQAHRHTATLHQRTHPAPFEQRLSLGRRTTQGVRQMVLIDQDNTTRRRPRNNTPDATGIAAQRKLWGSGYSVTFRRPAQSLVCGGRFEMLPPSCLLHKYSARPCKSPHPIAGFAHRRVGRDPRTRLFSYGHSSPVSALRTPAAPASGPLRPATSFSQTCRPASVHFSLPTSLLPTGPRPRLSMRSPSAA